MGVDAADFDEDGWIDLFVANIDQEIFSLYRNNRDQTFNDAAMPSGISMSTRWMSGWGRGFFDYDNDGDMDLILANGFPDDLIDQLSHEVTARNRCCSFKNRARYSRTSARKAARFFPSNSPRAAWLSAISITTAASMCWFPTMTQFR